ncbi:5-formyltetrahydrofolate cyclo-ligase [Micromonospora pattaloongensis]|uniref:5-formyltetrahydrofolate cyclo-ligase n=1 Tax=Micromonospora pattaloongensis TaxID=405436 RepID=A0A1H3GMP9_9ACTN|nr:5-formyltetrahydrofolate cyclo-ligase [Micromonospora pattaloongensis]SDY04310.1 5-formyltetrahydrofolate cyclo-ligase [Micromonospora pattaloongensis]
MSDSSHQPEIVRAAKLELRRRLLAHRRGLPPEARAAAAGRVQAELRQLVRRLAPRCVAGYVPVGSEPGGPDLPDVLADAVGPGGRVLLPVLRPDLDLEWAEHRRGAELHAAGRGLREPTGPRLGVRSVTVASLVVLPALAVDGSGVRLGRGGGSYDRALARVDPAALTVALLHDGELLDTVPTEPHDGRVRAVITPAGLRWLPVAGV